jgi:hypothetical protein
MIKMENTELKIWKIVIIASILLFVVSSAGAIACETHKCGDYCVHDKTSAGCTGAQISNTKCEDVGCLTSCWGFWSSGGTNNLAYNNGGKFHADCKDANKDVCVGSNGRADYDVSSAYFYPNGTQLTCANLQANNLPSQMYSKVIPISLPLHFTFGIYDTFNTLSRLDSSLRTLACSSTLYGDPRASISCTNDKNTYSTFNATRYNFGWTVAFDTIVVASKTDEPIPMLVGKNLTVNSGQPTAYQQLCNGDNLCYTEALR